MKICLTLTSNIDARDLLVEVNKSSDQDLRSCLDVK